MKMNSGMRVDIIDHYGDGRRGELRRGAKISMKMRDGTHDDIINHHGDGRRCDLSPHAGIPPLLMSEWQSFENQKKMAC